MHAHGPETGATRRRSGRRIPLLARLSLAVGVLLAVAAPAALAAPAWRLDALANSTAAPGSTLAYQLELRNVGDADANGAVNLIRVTGALPTGLTVQRVTAVGSGWDCSSVVVGAQTFRCDINRTVGISTPSNFRRLGLEAAVDGAASGVLTTGFDVAGGAASAVSTVAPATITTAPPEFGIAAFDAEVTADPAGAPFTQAAGHPYAATTSIDFNTFRHPEPLKGDLTPVEATKTVEVDLPPGFFGDPSGVDQCTLPQLASVEGVVATPFCAPSSQVGVTYVRTNTLLFGNLALGPVPVFNMVPPVDAPARLGFNVSGTIVTLDVSLRSESDYGLTAHVRNISEGLAVASTTLTLWGVPADPIHDPERACPGDFNPFQGGETCPSGAPRTAFLRNPTSCTPPGVGLPTTLRMDSWVDPGDIRERTIFSHLPSGYPFAPADWGPQQGTTNCEDVPFDPRIAVTPDITTAAQPTGYEFEVTLPQTNDPEVIGQSDLRKAVVTLPLGVNFSTSATAGLQGCSPEQINLRSAVDSSCPNGSKLGSVTIDVPALEEPLTGSIYLAGPHDNPFDTLIALYVVARGQGITLKLPGRVDLDQLTGQVTTTFEDNPQAPFSRLRLQFKGGPRAPIVNPRACGAYTTRAQFTGWSGAVVETDSTFNITKAGSGTPCPGAKFAPTFTAGTESNAGGSSSPFHVRFTRADDDEELSGLTLDMPGGLLGRIADVTLCSDVQANAGTCSEASRIGTVSVGAGAGPNPFYITNGRLYLTGPYKGAPFGLSVVVPAVAGPFDLGNVVVRQAVFVDKHTAELRIVSDPLPTMLQGVRIGVRDVRVAIDRPGFFLNPTSCEEMTIAGAITSASGLSAVVAERFQASECANLPLRPRMVLRVGGRRGQTRRGRTTPLTSTLRQTPGQTGLRKVQVTLPTVINSRLTVINDACTRAEYEAGNCEAARAGDAVAVTPLLRDPLRGGVYFVRNGNPLPDLFVRLRGQVEFDLIGRITIPGSKRLRTTFDLVPDVPVSSFTLKLRGGRRGSIGNAANLCSRRGRSARATLAFTGQNGKELQVRQRLKVRGCRARGSRRRR